MEFGALERRSNRTLSTYMSHMPIWCGTCFVIRNREFSSNSWDSHLASLVVECQRDCKSRGVSSILTLASMVTKQLLVNALV